MTLEDPAPGPREVVVQVAACGICGTDLHILEGEFAPSLPIVPGHEFAGVVVAEALALFERGEGRKIQVLPLACSRLTDNSQRGSAGMTIREELSCVPLLC